MPAGNVARIGIGIQTAKGTRSANPLFWLNLTGGGLRPVPETEQRSETGLGRDVGDTYIRLLSSTGDPSVLLRPKTAALLLYAVMGAKAVTGTTTYTHTLTPANDQPYLTIWKELGGLVNEVYDDCKITGMNIEWAAGGDVTASLSIMGLKAERLSNAAAATVGAVGTHDQAVPFRVPGAVYTLGGARDRTLTGGNFNIEAGQNAIQTDDIFPSYIEPGQRTISFGYEGIFVTVDRYAKVFYGGAAGTAMAQTIWEEAISFEFGDFGANTNPGLRLTMARALFSEATSNPDPGGAPLTLSVAGAAGRPASGAIATAEVKNDVAAYDAA